MWNRFDRAIQLEFQSSTIDRLNKSPPKIKVPIKSYVFSCGTILIGPFSCSFKAAANDWLNKSPPKIKYHSTPCFPKIDTLQSARTPQQLLLGPFDQRMYHAADRFQAIPGNSRESREKAIRVLYSDWMCTIEWNARCSGEIGASVYPPGF